jgi:hypothetical protein
VIFANTGDRLQKPVFTVRQGSRVSRHQVAVVNCRNSLVTVSLPLRRLA